MTREMPRAWGLHVQQYGITRAGLFGAIGLGTPFKRGVDIMDSSGA